MKGKVVAAVFFAMALGTMFVPTAKASVADGPVMFTIKGGPVELPGRVIEPGKYQLNFEDQEHKVVEISKVNGDKPVGLFMVEPTRRYKATDNPSFHFSEVSKSAPERLNGFFFPDLDIGYKFLYPQSAPPASTTIASAATSSR